MMSNSKNADFDQNTAEALHELHAAIEQFKWSLEQCIVRSHISSALVETERKDPGANLLQLFKNKKISLEASIAGCNSCGHTVRDAEKRLLQSIQAISNIAVGKLVRSSGILLENLGKTKALLEVAEAEARKAEW